MADLITNLQSIYNTKLQIKEAIGTDSDVFSDYPAYISDLKPSGYTYITANGDYNVSAYSDVNVNVSGGSAVLGGLSVTENGEYLATSYAYDGFDVVNVNVPVPPGYIVPEGTITIDTVGTHDVTSYASAYVDIQVPTYVFGYHTITNNGTTYASTYGLDGFTYVDVNVSGGGTPTLNVSGQYGMYNGKYYIYDTNLMTYLTLAGPITNVGLGDTVSGTVEYSDIDGTGMYGSYIYKNFSGTNTQDSGRVYTSLSVNNYYWNSTTLVSTVSGSVSSNYYSLTSGMAMTYYLPSDYSGSTIEAGSTVYCYVSEGYPMAMQENWINEVVNVVTPTLTGASYSTDSGMTWNAMTSDVMINGYSVDNLGRSISSMSGDYLHVRLEYDNGASYKYITNYVSIDSGSMSPYSNPVSKDSMIMSMTIWNNSAGNIEVSKIGVTNDTIYVYWAQGITYSYRLVATDSTGAPTGTTYDMTNDPAMSRYYYHWYEDNTNLQYFYVQKYVVGGAGVEDYKPSGETGIENGDSYNVSTANTGFFKRDETIRCKINFNYNASTVSCETDEHLRLNAPGGSELLLVYEMSSGGNRFTTAGVTGCSFFDGNDDEYKPAENTTISSGYDGSLNVTTSGTGTLDFGAGTFMMYYLDDPMGGKNIYIHDEATA